MNGGGEEWHQRKSAGVAWQSIEAWREGKRSIGAANARCAKATRGTSKLSLAVIASLPAWRVRRNLRNLPRMHAAYIARILLAA